MEVIDKEMKSAPLLSISIPTWNRAKFLAISLESFLDQMKGINPEEVELFSDKCFEAIKKDIYINFVDALFNYRLLVEHNGVKKQGESNGWSRNGFEIDGAKEILFTNYGNEPYFYWSMMKMYLRKWVAPIYHLIKT